MIWRYWRDQLSASGTGYLLHQMAALRKLLAASTTSICPPTLWAVRRHNAWHATGFKHLTENQIWSFRASTMAKILEQVSRFPEQSALRWKPLPSVFLPCFLPAVTGYLRLREFNPDVRALTLPPSYCQVCPNHPGSPPA